MSMLGINLTLSLGSVIPEPAPLEIMRSLVSVDVTQSDDGPCAFQMSFTVDRSGPFTDDNPLLASGLLNPPKRVIVSVTLGGDDKVLIDGLITHQQLTSGGPSSPTLLTVTGEDVSVMMDIVESSIEYPALPDVAIVLLILAKYTMVGIAPAIIPPVTSFVRIPLEGTWQQTATDRSELKKLAANHGYIFCVRPSPIPLTNIAYWGPPWRIGPVQPALNVDLGPSTNVSQIAFSYDALAPTLVHGLVQDQELETIAPVLTVLSTRVPPLASSPALTANLPLVRNSLFNKVTQCSPGYQRDVTIIEAYSTAQSITDTSTDDVVTVEGELNTLRYGSLLTAPGLVDVRGAGMSYDGRYMVRSVTHQIRRDQYTQKFKLSREGLGSLENEVTT